MRFTTLLCLLLAAILHADPLVEARGTPFGPGDRCLTPLAAVELDGKLAECAGREPTIVLTPTAIQAFGRTDAQVDGAADASGRVWLAWTPDGFYVGAHLVDDQRHYDAKANPFATDMLMVSFLSGQRTALASQQERTLMMSWFPADGQPRPQGHAGSYVAVATADGYDVEGFLPFRVLGWQPQAGDWLRFYVIMVDQDGLTPDGKRNWGQYLYADTEMPRLRLLAAEGERWSGDIHTDEPELPPDYALFLSGTVDALAPGGRLRQLTVTDALGGTVYTTDLDAPLAAGQRTRLGIDLADLRLTPGRYTATLAFGAEPPVLATTTFAIREAAGATSGAPGIVASLRYLRFSLPEDPPPYTPPVVSRQDYLDLARELWPFKHFKVPFEDYPEKIQVRHYGVHTASYLIDVVLAYKITGDWRYAATAIAFMQAFDAAVQAGEIIAEQYSSLAIGEMYHLVEDDPRFPPEEKARWRRLVVQEAQATWANEKHQGGLFEYGNNNRGFWYLFRYGYALKLAPDVPEAAIWRPYVERMWPYYLKIKDVDENTTGYGIGDPEVVLDYVRLMGLHDEYFADPDARYFHGRFAHELTPYGDLPTYGDGASLGGGINILPQMEHMAALTDDGRYKWAANRAFDYFRRFKTDELDYVEASNYLTRVLWAVYYCDDAVAEVQPDWPSELLTRKKWLPGDWSKKFYWYMDENVTIPHKMVLRSGWAADDLFALVECAPGGGHAPALPGSILYMVKDRSLLFTANPYQTRQRQNVVYVNDREGLADKRFEDVSVPLFTDHARVTVGRVHIDGYQELPVASDRTVFFLKNRLLVVKDVLTFEQAGLYDVRCNWQTQNAGPVAGPNWVNTFYDTVENWLHIPAGYRTWDRDLFIWNSPQPGCRMYARNHQDLRLDMFGPVAVGQKWSGRLRAGERRHFTTVLFPHRARRDTAKLADDFAVADDSPERTVLTATVDGLPLLVVHNESGELLHLPFGDREIVTDARCLVVEQLREAPGLSLTATGVSVIEVGSKEVLRQDERTNFDIRL